MTTQSTCTDERSRVLAVDDVEANLVAIDAVLEELDCEVVRARSGNEALSALLRDHFAVMILDVQMPGMDGYEVALHARSNAQTREVPIIFLTATHGTREAALRGYGSGAVDFLLKPLDATVLRSKVRVFLELHAARRQISDKNAALERAYRDLKTTQAQLVQSAKMASLGELVAGIAHEINNPLAFVCGHLDTVRRNLGVVHAENSAAWSPDAVERWERADHRLGDMQTGLERIGDLVVKLRTFSRKDEGRRKRITVSESVNATLRILAHRMDRIQVETHFGDPDELDCYPDLLNQAVMNLVANAVDAVQGEGTIGIATGADGKDYQITVTDDGPGVPAAIRERVYEPFFTTKPVGQGTGLGLSITYSIVEQHGGTFRLENRSGGGAAAIIRIPLGNPEGS